MYTPWRYHFVSVLCNYKGFVSLQRVFILAVGFYLFIFLCLGFPHGSCFAVSGLGLSVFRGRGIGALRGAGVWVLGVFAPRTAHMRVLL